jgi:DNA-binding response OmpR family regulator
MEILAVRRIRIAIDAIRPASTGQIKTPRVLFVSSDADLRAAAARVLTGEGYDIVTAAHSGHAQLAWRAASRPFSILIADLTLDCMSGPALMATLRRQQPSLRALYMADVGTAAREGLIVRPFTRDDLLMKIDAACRDATSRAF